MRTELHLCAEQGDALRCRELVRQGIHQAAVDRSSSLATALHIAAEKGHATVVEVLLLSATSYELNLRRFPMEACGYLGETALILAIEQGHVDVVRLLLARPDLDVNLRSQEFEHREEFGLSAAEMAVINRRLDILKLLLQRDDLQIDTTDEDGNTLLHCIADRNGVFDIAEQNLGEPDAAFFYDRDICASLLATQECELQVNKRNKDGLCPLQIAIQSFNLDVADEIIQCPRFDHSDLWLSTSETGNKLMSVLYTLYRQSHRSVPQLVMETFRQFREQWGLTGPTFRGIKSSSSSTDVERTQGNDDPWAADIRLEDDGFDSDVEIIGAKLFGVEVHGGRLAVTEGIELCRALNAALGPKLQVKEEEKDGEEEEDEHVNRDEFPEQVGPAFLQLPQYLRVASVRDLRFSHDSIRSCFSKGESFEELIGKLRRGEIDPLQDEPFRAGLQVWRFRGKNICRNNRRLYCLKKFQDSRREDVMVNIEVTELGPVIEKFCSSNTTRNGGRSVRVRKPPPKRLRTS